MLTPLYDFKKTTSKHLSPIIYLVIKHSNHPFKGKIITRMPIIITII